MRLARGRFGGRGCTWFGGAGRPDAAPGSRGPRGRLLCDKTFLAEERKGKAGVCAAPMQRWAGGGAVELVASCSLPARCASVVNYLPRLQIDEAVTSLNHSWRQRAAEHQARAAPHSTAALQPRYVRHHICGSLGLFLVLFFLFVGVFFFVGCSTQPTAAV